MEERHIEDIHCALIARDNSFRLLQKSFNGDVIGFYVYTHYMNTNELPFLKEKKRDSAE